MKLFEPTSKKGQINLDFMKQAVVMLGLVALIAAAVAIALNDFQGDTTTNSYAFNITGNGLTGVDNASSYLDTIGTIVGVAVLITLVIGAFAYVGRR